MEAVTDYIDDEVRFFITNVKSQVVEAFNKGNIEEAWALSNKENITAWLEEKGESGYFQVVAVVKGNNHWDDGFLRVSDFDGVPSFYAWGMYSPLGEIANQGYFDGEYDSGIAADPEDDSY